MKTLAFLPTGDLSAYEDMKYNDLQDYYNPDGYFDEVVCVSPYSEKYREVQGIQIRTVTCGEEYKRTISEICPDVIRVYGPFFSADFALYNKVEDIPVIVSVHDVVHISPSIEYADKVICMSNVVAEKVKGIGVEENRIVIMPNRVDNRLFCNKRGEEKTIQIRSSFPKGKMLISVARRCEQKNTDNIVRALKYLPDDYFCVFIGKAQTDFSCLAKDEGVDGRCFWIDGVFKSELAYWYSAADCFCLPSRWEGFGIVFLEAAACGTPIVTSDIAPMNEYLNNTNAILVRNYLNPIEIAEACETACTSDDVDSMTREALKLRDLFSKKKVDDKEVEIYSSLIGEISINREVSLKLNNKLYIWSAGERGKKMCEYLESKGHDIICFIDQDKNKWGRNMMGRRVEMPDGVVEGQVIVPNDFFQDVYENNRCRAIKFIDFNRVLASYNDL